MEVIKQLRNDLMKRTEIELVISESSNPGFAESAKKVSEKFKAEEDRIAVKKVNSSFGKNKFVIEANVYDSAKDMIHLEPKKKEKKTKGVGQ